MKSLQIAFCALLFASAAVSRAAKPAGAMVCAGGSGSLTFNMSFFDIGVSDPTDVGSSSSGVGAGKVTLQPLVIHVHGQRVVWTMAEQGPLAVEM
jgi:hypothetical protein